MNEYTYSNILNNNIPKGKNSLLDDNLTLVPVNTGHNRGNLFKNLYWPYKYEAQVNPGNERERLLNKIQQYNFAAIDLDLYLDVFPDDMQAIGLFNQYREEALKYQSEYDRKYGSLLLSGNLDQMPWEWLNGPWPWERM